MFNSKVQENKKKKKEQEKDKKKVLIRYYCRIQRLKKTNYDDDQTLRDKRSKREIHYRDSKKKRSEIIESRGGKLRRGGRRRGHSLFYNFKAPCGLTD